MTATTRLTAGGNPLVAEDVLADLVAASDAELASHASDSTAIHGITNTASLLTGIRVEDEGVSTVAAATALNFAGSGVTVTDAGSNEALVTISGGGGGSGDVSTSDTDVTGWGFVLDEDTMASDSDEKLPTQQSVKAYVDGKASIQSTDTNKLDVYTIGNVTYLDVADLASGGSSFSDDVFVLTNTNSGNQYQFNGNNLAGPAVFTMPSVGGTLMLTDGTLDGATVSADAGLFLGTTRQLDQAETYGYMHSLATVTMNYSGGFVRPYLDSNATHLYKITGDGSSANRFVRARMKMTNVTTADGGSSTNFGGGVMYDDGCTVVADTKTGMGAGFYTSYRAGPAYSVLDGGTITSGSLWGFITQHSLGTGVSVGALESFYANPTITGSVTNLRNFASIPTVTSGGTVTTLTHLRASAYAGAGTVTTQYGLDIAAMTNATTNVGIRNASTTVLTPTANANITAATATIAHTASLVTLTANASYTLTSAPTITDGVDGEELIIINVDTADTITIQDQGTLANSNLRLSANTVALGPRDSIRLVYNSTIGDWVQVSQTNVL